jgi:hypothetical protein
MQWPNLNLSLEPNRQNVHFMGDNLLFHWEGSRPKMAEYRAYILGPDDKICKAVDLFCPDDEIAKQKAKQLVNGHDVEP